MQPPLNTLLQSANMKIWKLISSIEDPELINFSQKAYIHCVKWFGEPDDEKWQCTLNYGYSNGCARNWLLREYVIVIRNTYKYAEQKKAIIAHEIYHRATMRRKGLRQSVWVDEMVAFLVSQQILRAENLSNYADLRIQRHLEKQVKINISHLHKVRRRRIIIGYPCANYPTDFGASVACLGTELEYLVGWSNICRLVNCTSWDDWLDGLPLESRSIVLALLKIGQ